MINDASSAAFERAQALLPGGVNSPVRAFRGVGGVPRFIDHGAGAYLYDIDGNQYIDYVLSWGPLILGHAYPAVVEAICAQAQRGTSFGAPTELESELAELVIAAVPSVEMVRFVSSGTEATMSAIRLARAYTQREKIIKFEGCYHGHADPFLVQAGSGVATLGLPDSPGVLKSATSNTLTAAFNDLEAVEALFKANVGQVAALVIEPVAGNMGFVLPREGYLAGLRQLCDQHGALLIFDEVMTGFRVAYGGAQAYFNVMPDLTCLGKVVGGGLPAAAYGGRREIMQMVAPAGTMYQAGTLSGNPLAMVAGIVTLREIAKPEVFERLTGVTSTLCQGFWKAAFKNGIPFQAHKAGSMWGFFFAGDEVYDFTSAKKADTTMFGKFFHAMLEQGVYLAPSQFEAAFVSAAHTDELVAQTINAAQAAFASIRS